jgi:pSer/pThr/pTyr-binding forkhead associated (FHA) protein
MDMLIGRRNTHKNIHPDIDLSPLDVGCHVYGAHAEIKQATGGFYLEDKGSMNGTFVNGNRLKPQQPAPLRPFDICQFGYLKFYFTGRKLKQVPSQAKTDTMIRVSLVQLDELIEKIKAGKSS